MKNERQPRITDRVARVDRLAEPARRAGHRHQPVGHRARRSRTATSSSPAARRARSPTSPRARARARSVDRAAQGHPGRQGTVGKLFTDEQLYTRASTRSSSRRRWSPAISQQGQRHARHAAARSGGLRQAERRARQPAGDDPTDQRRRRQPRPAAEGRALAKSLTSASAQRRADHRRLNRGEGTAGKLLTEKELYDRFNWRGRAARQAHDRPRARGRGPPASCCTTSSCMTI